MSTSSWETQFISPAGQKATQSLRLFGCTTSKSHTVSPGVAKVLKHRALQLQKSCNYKICLMQHKIKKKKKEEMDIP